MLTMLLGEFGGYILAGLLALAGVAGVYFKGRKTGKTEEIVKRQEVIQKQADEAKQEVRDVETKIEAAPDVAVRELARRKWVRK